MGRKATVVVVVASALALAGCKSAYRAPHAQAQGDQQGVGGSGPIGGMGIPGPTTSFGSGTYGLDAGFGTGGSGTGGAVGGFGEDAGFGTGGSGTVTPGGFGEDAGYLPLPDFGTGH